MNEFENLPPVPSTDVQPASGQLPPVVTEPRNFAGWIALAVMFGFVILLGLIGTASEPKAQAPEPASYMAENLTLRQVSSMRELVRTFQTPETKKQLETSSQQLATSLDDPIAKLIPKTGKDPMAARLYAAMRREQGSSIPVEKLTVLTSSKDEKDRTFARIYTEEKLTVDEAEAIAKALPDEPFVYQLAKVHAYEKAGKPEARSRYVNAAGAIFLSLAMFGGFLLFATGSVLWIVFFSMRSQGKLQPLGLPQGGISLRDADRLAIRAAAIFGFFLLLQIIVPLLRVGSFAMAATGIGILTFVFLTFLIKMDGKRLSLEGLGLSGKNFGRNVLYGVAGFAMELPVALFMALVGVTIFRFLPAPSHPATNALQGSKDLMTVLPIILFGGIIAPIWEEIMFRGMLFQGLARTTGRVLNAAVVSSLLFAAIHPQGIALWLALGTVAMVSCGLIHQTRSLVPSIVMHMLHNLTLLTLTILLL